MKFELELTKEEVESYIMQGWNFDIHKKIITKLQSQLSSQEAEEVVELARNLYGYPEGFSPKDWERLYEESKELYRERARYILDNYEKKAGKEERNEIVQM